jgi:23S rRNA (cytidine2498-2'-O)-methyltransferase
LDRLHVWERDAAEPGEHGFEPGVSPLAEEIGQVIAAAAGEEAPPVNRLAKPGQRVLDVVLVEPNQWWVGWHRAAAPPSRWPGGVFPVDVPDDAVSRAYLKMAEALAWSRLPIEKGEHVVEIGSAPGGSAQRLLDRGCVVTGIDPAEMAPEVLQREHFTHVRARSKDLKRREFHGIPWLTADLNVAPNYTLDAVESIVTHRTTHVRGLLLTLKLIEWELAEHIPEYLERVRNWGFEYVRARQLSFNRQEICVAALRRRQMRRKR